MAGAGAAAAACGPPDTGDKLIPYLVRPEDIVPGTNTLYATVLTEAGPEPLGVHAWVRDGRAIKLEGNPNFPGNRGRLSALGQAALQDLYDPDRLRGPQRRRGADLIAVEWDEATTAAATAVREASARDGGLVLLTPAVTGTSDRFYDEWASANGAERIRLQPLAFQAERAAQRIAFGRDEIPSYEIQRADRIVCFGADFLDTWLSPVQFNRRFSAARDVERGRHAKFTFVGPRLSLTGMSADEWIPVRPGTEGAVALAVANEVARLNGAAGDGPGANGRAGGAAGDGPDGAAGGYTLESAAQAADVPVERIRRLAEEIAGASAPIAIPPGLPGEGADATQAHLAVATLNSVSGAVGNTVVFGQGPARGEPGPFSRISDLIDRMRAGSVHTVIALGVNPVYSLPPSTGLAEALANVAKVIAITPHYHETAAAADWILAASHELESWNDVEVGGGVLGLAQPVMVPMFDTRPRQDILMQIAAGGGQAGGAGGGEQAARDTAAPDAAADAAAGQAGGADQIGAAAAGAGAADFLAYLRGAWRERYFPAGTGASFDEWWNERLRWGGLYPGAEGEPETLFGIAGPHAEQPTTADASWLNGAPAGAAPSANGGAGGGAGPGGGGDTGADTAAGGGAGGGAVLSAEAAAFPFTLAGGAGGRAGGGAADAQETDGRGGFDLIVFPTGRFYDGRGANRSWMQEIPDSVTKVAWSSWVEIHPSTAEPLGIETGTMVEVRSEAGAVRAPAYVSRTIRADAIGIPLGQGHEQYGRYAQDRGVNAVVLLPARVDERSGALAYAGARVEITNTGEETLLAVLQGSDSDLGRELAEMMSVEAATAAIASHEIDLTELVEAAYDSDPASPYRWGMSIDLNACTGCGACVTACYAENNIPTVGEVQAARGREMSWLRIERYFEDTPDGFQTVHSPMLCQHCGDAPCEPVCPVYAAYHTPEGLNAQVYNRCVGTRYCANNCPYKVRRFNWFGYEFPSPLDLQLNPDVTVRQKGVMEKCTFCVQRIRRAQIAAKEEGRLVEDGEIQTACMQTCPTQAIVFGNLKDPESRVSRLAKSARGYASLGELNTRPAITYLKAVRHAEIAEAEHGAEGDA